MGKRWFEYIDDILFLGVMIGSVGFLVYVYFFGW